MCVCTDKVTVPVVIRAQAKNGLEWNPKTFNFGDSVRERILLYLERTGLNDNSEHYGDK